MVYEEVTRAHFYETSKVHLKDNLKQFSDNKDKTFISLGRKGIKIFEFLFHSHDEDKENENDEDKDNEETDNERPKVVSEHALPFISQKDKGCFIDYYLMDDALYYGSSAMGVAKEIYAFEKIYNIHGRDGKKIPFYSAIDANELRPHFEQYIGEVYAESTNNVNPATDYYHYFAKHLAKDIRTLEDTFEIEYPIVTFNLKFNKNKPIDSNGWLTLFKGAFTTSGTTIYSVEHQENFSINILFDNIDGCSFRKLRIFPSNCYKDDDKKTRIDRVKVVCMAPHPVLNSDYLLEHVFDDANEEYRSLWLKIFNHCRIPSSEINSDNIIDYLTIARRRCNKSLVIMLNYLLSYSTFIEQRDKLKEVFCKADLEAEFKGVDEKKGLFYLLGDEELCSTVSEQLKKFYDNGTLSGDVYTSKNIHFDYTIFENSDADETTTALLHAQDKKMLEKSQNIEEALSALFFNQDSYFEKQIIRSNPITQDFSRLRMGYTFDGLYKTIDFFMSSGMLEKEVNDVVYTIHRWVDQRIGEASIVPQYVLDEKSEHWVRAFRHGENEDTLLSHLAQYVLMIFREWKKTIPFEWIEKSQFQKLLASTFDKIGTDGNEIVESKNITFYVDEDSGYLMFKNSNYENDPAKTSRNVLEYLIDMCIFTEEEGKISINKRTNFILPPAITTLESDTENDIKEMVRAEAEKVKKAAQKIDIT